MSAIVPSYAYTLIKLDFLKPLIMDNESLLKLNKINEINEFLELINPYYPNLEIKVPTIEFIETALINNYIRMIGKIILYSPESMRMFLRSYLIKFEILNIKQCIIASILGLNIEEKKKNINFLVEQYLDNEDFIDNLLKLSTLDEIQLFMKKTKYNIAIKEGILYFKNNNEIFVLEAFLDQFYYANFNIQLEILSKKEKGMISLYAKYKAEIYNLNVIYRGIKNKIDKKLLSQFLINSYLFFDEEKNEYLLNLDNVDVLISVIEDILQGSKEINQFYKIFGIDQNHLIWSIEKLYINYFFRKFKVKIDDIDLLTIFKILELIIQKEREISFDIIPNLVRILHKKFDVLKARKKLGK